jgi:hypothetical protein
MCKLTVIENNSIGFIFGLDNMRSHRCNIDLGRSAIIFPDAGIDIKFLSDGEIKKIKELADEEEIEDVKALSKEDDVNMK